MFELSSLDVYYAVKELQQLIGAKVEKIFQSDVNKKDVLFIMYLRDVPKIHLRFSLPGMICISQEKPDYPTQPPGFAMFLRKYLGGSRLQAIEQIGFDRIIKFTFATKTMTYELIVELMPPGNMLLLTEGRIMNLLENQQFKDRVLRGKQAYVLPPSVDITKLSDEEMINRIMVSTKDSIVVTLAVNFSLGGVYAEEACARAGIVKTRNDLKAAEIGKIVHALRDLFDQPIQAHADEQRIYPFKLESKSVQPAKETSFLHAVAALLPVEHVEKKDEKRLPQQSKLQVIVDSQRQQITKFEEEITQNQRKGERIFEEYQLLQEILSVVHEARQTKKDIAEELKRFKQVKSYNNATGEIELEL